MALGSEFGPLGLKFGLVGRDTAAYRGRITTDTAKVTTATDDERLRNSVYYPVIGPEDESPAKPTISPASMWRRAGSGCCSVSWPWKEKVPRAVHRL